MIPQRPARGRLDTRNPVNWQHPLNAGLAAWWLAVPNFMGGGTWSDLCRLSDGTFMSGPTWPPAATHPGGWSSLYFGGSGARVAVPPAVTGSKFTIAAWVNQDSHSGYHAVYADGEPRGFYMLNGQMTYYPNGVLNGTTLAASTFYHVTITATGALLTGYLNGQFDSSVAFSDVLPPTVPKIGSDLNGNDFLGYIDDLRLYNRALSAAEAWSLYNLSALGYPGVLNRCDPVAWVGPAAAGPAFDPSMFPWTNDPGRNPFVTPTVMIPY